MEHPPVPPSDAPAVPKVEDAPPVPAIEDAPAIVNGDLTHDDEGFASAPRPWDAIGVIRAGDQSGLVALAGRCLGFGDSNLADENFMTSAKSAVVESGIGSSADENEIANMDWAAILALSDVPGGSPEILTYLNGLLGFRGNRFTLELDDACGNPDWGEYKDRLDAWEFAIDGFEDKFIARERAREERRAAREAALEEKS